LQFYRQLKSTSIEKLSGTLTEIDFVEDRSDIGLGIEMPNGHILSFKKGVTPDTIKVVADEYMAILKREATESRKEFVCKAIAAWLFSSAFVYGIGFGVAWIIRGFRPSHYT
jgi:predicted AAA+ superfamily ATPase